jgi:2-polyprenyl-6-methoxyphenol hydroxylase-like FAD-dependent oxidoreductase
MRVYGSPQSAQGLRWQDVAKQEPVKPLAHMVDAGPLLHRLEHAIAAESRIQCIHHADVVCASQTPGLTVVCEGKASVSRERYGFEQIKEPYHYQAIVARLLSHLPHEGVAWQWFSPQGILALLPLPGTQDRPGHELALVWSVPNQKAAHLMALTSIPTAFVEALHADMSPDGYAALGGLTLTSHVAHWPLQRALVTHAVAPGVVLLGDAAHTVHPLSGQGLNLGLGDVKALSEVLAQRPYWQSLGDWHLLRRYERARRLSWALTAASTDFLHHFFALGGVFSKASLCLPWLFEYVPGVKSVQQSLIHAARRGFAFH